MKKRMMALMLCGILSAGLLAGCQKGEDGKTEQGEVEEQTEDAGDNDETESDEEESNVGIANPWREIDEEEAKGACARLFKVPDGAELLGWTILDDATEALGVSQPLVECNFEIDDLIFNARALQGAPMELDISGMYYDWDEGRNVTLANWGGGNMKGTVYMASDSAGTVERIAWYDVEIGIAYSLSVAAADLDGFDIQAVAEAMYDPSNESSEDTLPRDDAENAAVTVIDVVGDYLSGGYGDDVDQIVITVEKIYDTEALEGDDDFLPDLVNLDSEDIAFEISYELVPAEGADVDLLTVPDGVYDESTGRITELYRLGVLRLGDDGSYEVTDFGTGW